MSSIVQLQQDMLARMQQMTAIAEGRGPQPGIGAQEESVGQSFVAALRAVDADQHKATAARTAVETGESDDLVGAMVSSLQASVSFSALLQVRNKLTTAFDDVMRMPI